MPKPKYTLNDFDLLVSKSVFIMRQVEELNRERSQIMDEITNLLIEHNLPGLTTTKGVSVRLVKMFPVKLGELSQTDHNTLREWCKEQGAYSINYSSLVNMYNRGDELPIKLPDSHKVRAKLINTKDKDTSIDLVKEQLKSLDHKDDNQARDAHIKDLRKSGLTFAQIRKVYPMSVTHIARICKNRNILPAKPDHKVQVSRQI